DGVVAGGTLLHRRGHAAVRSEPLQSEHRSARPPGIGWDDRGDPLHGPHRRHTGVRNALGAQLALVGLPAQGCAAGGGRRQRVRSLRPDPAGQSLKAAASAASDARVRLSARLTWRRGSLTSLITSSYDFRESMTMRYLPSTMMQGVPGICMAMTCASASRILVSTPNERAVARNVC